jgi:hypothetical protein
MSGGPMPVGSQLPLWIPCHICGQPMMPDPASEDFFEPFEASFWADHRACTWAQLRWSGIPTELVDRVRRMTV